MSPKILLIAASTIFMLGCVSIFSTTSAEVLDHTLSSGIYLQLLKQLGYALVGLLLAIGVYKAGWEEILAWSPLLMNVFMVLLVLTLIPGIGKEVNGSKRWISILGFSFQPSEFVKVIVPAFFLYYYPNAPFFKLLLRCLIPIVLILIEPNNGTALVITLALVVTFWLLEVPLKFWAFPLIGLALLGGIFASQLPYVSKRLKVYLDPESDLKGKGHQPHQAKIATGSGGLFGKGAAKSLQKLSYLPEAQNDYIAAIFAEEFGFLGMLVLILLYMALAYAGFSIAGSSPFPKGMAFAGVMIFLITFQAFLNLGVVSGLLPSTGLNLPLFSQGGTSLMVNMGEIALLYQMGGVWQKC